MFRIKHIECKDCKWFGMIYNDLCEIPKFVIYEVLKSERKDIGDRTLDDILNNCSIEEIRKFLHKYEEWKDCVGKEKNKSASYYHINELNYDNLCPFFKGNLWYRIKSFKDILKGGI